MPLILLSSNAILERCFFYMSRVKTDSQSRVSEDVQDNQIQLCVDKPKSENFSSEVFL